MRRQRALDALEVTQREVVGGLASELALGLTGLGCRPADPDHARGAHRRDEREHDPAATFQSTSVKFALCSMWIGF